MSRTSPKWNDADSDCHYAIVLSRYWKQGLPIAIGAMIADLGGAAVGALLYSHGTIYDVAPQYQAGTDAASGGEKFSQWR
jgi:hypothetical protein